MNTRLQVEHPVTEEVTGLDLVEQMIRVAAGEKLSFGQDDVKLDGWSIETRVYAEDPYRGFLPSTGRLTRYTRPPERREEQVRVRVDDGVTEGSEISMFYDPMVAKLITWGEDREAAIDAQIDALDAFELDGIGDNVDFLSALMQHPRFRSGDITTGFIAEEYPDGFTGAPADSQLLSDIAVIGGMIGAITEERNAGSTASSATECPRPSAS
jgi:propionyl-CoA carboxylase alpha chain